MRKRIRYFSVTVLLGVGCGGGTKAPGVDGSSDSRPPSGVDGHAGACASLDCLRAIESLMLDCAGTATCVLEKGPGTPTTSTTQCFDNGVKIQTTGSMTSEPTGYTSTTTFAVKKGDSLCYTRTFATGSMITDGGRVSSIQIIMQDASGTTLVTTQQDQDNVVTVTCPGSEPTVFASSCGFSESAARSGFLVKTASPPTCTEGACSF